MNTVYFAKHILLDSGEVLLNGAVAVCDGLITAVGPRGLVRRSSDERLVNLGDILLLPGFINMHTHLEETPIRSYLKEPGEEYTGWNSTKYSRMMELSPEQICGGIRLCAREMVSQGVTTVVDSTRTGISAQALAGEAIRAVIIREVANEGALDEGIAQARTWLDSDDAGGAFKYGAAPYALYSLTQQGHRKLIELGYDTKCLWSCHVAESAEEIQAFYDRSGDFYESQTRGYPWPTSGTRLHPVEYALAANLIPTRAILYHCNYTTGYDLGLLAAKRASVVICRRYNSVMEHKPLSVEIARNRGVRLCLGTEGMVAAGDTNLFDELFELKMKYPHISARELISWVTKNPAAALQASDKLGSLTPGKLADIIGVRFPYGERDNILEKLLISEPMVGFVMIGGEEIIVD
ncbi:MAG: amidohydrolase family protein [Chitinispirillia bacterium]|nr:amidohydrolase family protein [Chitinispirillia bacterium]MCL2268160.1 amidohydrolase family protein [Chitinispirillia bacterium]